MKKKLIAILFSMLMVMSVLGGVTIAYANDILNLFNNTTITWESSGLDSEYDIGTTLTIPERSITVGENSAVATATVEYPNQVATTQNTVTLNVGGKYFVNYSVTVDGKVYSDRQTFMVHNQIATFGEDSSIWYGKHKLASKDEGLNIRLAEGDTLTFNKVIDLNSITSNDVLVEGFVTPDIVGSFDFEELYFTFTDVVNPNVFLKMRGRHYALGTSKPNTYWLAGGNGQTMSGWEPSSNAVHVGGRWGSPKKHSFAAVDYDGSFLVPDTAKFILQFDAKTLLSSNGGQTIVDHDDTFYFKNMWNGFESGMVKLTVHGSMYSASTANFCLTKVFGIDLTADLASDDEAPVIIVENTPAKYAKVGMEYLIPNATAFDYNDGVKGVQTSVYYNYSSPNAISIPVEDGKFVPNKKGVYVIEYVSIDNYGNKAIETIVVEAKDTLPELTISTEEAQRQISGVCGKEITFPEPSISGGAGNLTYTIQVELNGETIDVEDKLFIPEKAGNYNVIYTVKDYIGQTKVHTYQLTVALGNLAVFREAPELPKVFISGSSYVLPDLYAYDYRSGTLVKTLASATVKDSQGQTNVNPKGTFTPVANTNGELVTVTYNYDGASIEYKVPTVIVWETVDNRPQLRTARYFYGENLNFEYLDNSLEISANGLDASAGFTFANKLLTSNFGVEFYGVVGKSNYSGLQFILEDTLNGKTVSFDLTNKGTNTVLTIGELKATLTYSLRNGNKIGLSYRNNSVCIDNTDFAIAKWDDGSEFNGFESDFVYFSLKFIEAEKGATYGLQFISGQPFNILTTDFTSPGIIIDGVYGGTVNINDTIELPAAIASDILDPNTTITVTVRDANKKIAKTVDGTLLENVDGTKTYQIKIDSLGRYEVTFTAKDTFNRRANSRTFIYAINVEDNVAPEIIVNGEIKADAKVGDAVALPSFSYSDNATAKEDITVLLFVLNPNGRLVELKENSNSIKCAYAGEYEFRIILIDEAGNMSMHRQSFTVR